MYWLSSSEIESAIRDQNLDDAVCISLPAKTFEKDMNLSVSPAPAKDK